MEEDLPFIYCLREVIFNILGLVFFFIDLVLDVLAVVTFYQEDSYVAMGVLILLLLGSSVLLHTFSWLWYYELREERTDLGEYVYLEKYFKNRRLLGVLHLCQLAVFFRFACVTEISLRDLRSGSKEKEGIAVSLIDNLRFLRFIETFSENAPQLTLMVTVIVHSKRVELITGLKTLVSFVMIALSVVMYHYSIRAFKEKKAKMTLTPSLLYFLWNFLLITPRVAAVALFASTVPVLGCVIYFISQLFALFLGACLQKTDFMDSPAGEWLYRVTVALIWYFSWLNVSKQGNSKLKSIIYHFFIAVDIVLLLVLWWWHCVEDLVIFELPTLWVVMSVGSCYSVGITVQILYYKLCHSAKPVTEESGAPAPACMEAGDLGRGEVGAAQFRGLSLEPQKPLTGARKRMQILSDNFYS